MSLSLVVDLEIWVIITFAAIVNMYIAKWAAAVNTQVKSPANAKVILVQDLGFIRVWGCRVQALFLNGVSVLT